MSKRIKQMLISDLQQRLDGTTDLLVLNTSKLDANTDNRFRTELRNKEITVLTVKNNFARRALNDAGVSALDSLLEGPSTLVWGGEDIVALSKEISKWAKELANLQIKGGAIDGETLNEKGVVDLSKSPGRLELIGQIAGLALAPGSRLAGTLLGPARKVAGQVKTLADKEGE